MFENFSEKINKFGNSVKAGAGNVIDNTKRGVNNLQENFAQKSKIDTAKNNIKSAYISIGEKFYDENKDNVPAGYEEFFEMIDLSNREISDAEEEIRRISGIRICPGCGADVKKGVAFCTNCGYKMEEDAEEKNTTCICPNCQKSIPSDSTFCSYCGVKLEKQDEQISEDEE